MEVIGYVLATLVGISLGLIGSGGSILTVPVLVYIMGVNPLLATAYSLFIVGSTALLGGIQSAVQKRVDFKTVFIFGIPSILVVFATRLWIVPAIPDQLFSFSGFTLSKSIALMLLFAVVMILSSISMIRSTTQQIVIIDKPLKYNYPLIFLQGAIVGIIAGLVGAGGGFLIIPTLVLVAKMPIKIAVGTSLFIVAAQSLLGFSADLQNETLIDWQLLGTFTAFAITGIIIGIFTAQKIAGEKLKKTFGWFVLLMGIYIIVKELFLN